MLAVFLGAYDPTTLAQKSPSAGGDDLAAMRLENVRIEGQTVGEFFSALSLSHDIPIGVETDLGDGDEDTPYEVDFRAGTLADLLDQFVARHDRYAWGIKGGVVNIFPKDNYRDVILGELLRAEIHSFSVKEGTSCPSLEESLVNTPEIKRILAHYGITHRRSDPSGFYIPQLGRDFKLDISNQTLRTILNKVIRESPIARSWVVKRDVSDQALLVSLSARHEDLPTGSATPVFPKHLG
jgi:hypothetical protein